MFFQKMKRLRAIFTGHFGICTGYSGDEQPLKRLARRLTQPRERQARVACVKPVDAHGLLDGDGVDLAEKRVDERHKRDLKPASAGRRADSF